MSRDKSPGELISDFAFSVFGSTHLYDSAPHRPWIDEKYTQGDD
jgi:hypothetical protein